MSIEHLVNYCRGTPSWVLYAMTVAPPMALILIYSVMSRVNDLDYAYCNHEHVLLFFFHL